jgi:hypothetical protein
MFRRSLFQPFALAIVGGVHACVTFSHEEEATSNESRRAQGTVGVWLDDRSRTLLKKHHPKLADTRVAILQSRELVGSNVYEPLYGAVSTVRVSGVASSHTTEAVTATVSLSGLGGVDAVGLPAPVIGGAKAVDLISRLHSLGVVGASNTTKSVGASNETKSNSAAPTSWCGMVTNQHGDNKELLEFKNVPHEEGLELSGIICPSGLYEEDLHSCSWEPTKNKNTPAEPTEPTECPLCAFIKGGGCKDAFLPFQACLDAFIEEQKNDQSNTGEEKSPDCMALFAPVVECMQSTPAKREYYKGFMEDFSHLFKK